MLRGGAGLPAWVGLEKVRLHLKGPHLGLKGEKKDAALLIERQKGRQAGLGLVGAGGSREAPTWFVSIRS